MSADYDESLPPTQRLSLSDDESENVNALQRYNAQFFWIRAQTMPNVGNLTKNEAPEKKLLRKSR